MSSFSSIARERELLEQRKREIEIAEERIKLAEEQTKNEIKRLATPDGMLRYLNTNTSELVQAARKQFNIPDVISDDAVIKSLSEKLSSLKAKEDDFKRAEAKKAELDAMTILEERNKKSNFRFKYNSPFKSEAAKGSSSKKGDSDKPVRCYSLEFSNNDKEKDISCLSEHDYTPMFLKWNYADELAHKSLIRTSGDKPLFGSTLNKNIIRVKTSKGYRFVVPKRGTQTRVLTLNADLSNAPDFVYFMFLDQYFYALMESIKLLGYGKYLGRIINDLDIYSCNYSDDDFSNPMKYITSYKRFERHEPFTSFGDKYFYFRFDKASTSENCKIEYVNSLFKYFMSLIAVEVYRETHNKDLPDEQVERFVLGNAERITLYSGFDPNVYGSYDCFEAQVKPNFMNVK